MNELHRIDLAVAGKFHAFALASEFAALGRLGNLYCVHKTLKPPKNISSSAYRNRIDLAAWSALSRFGPVGYSHIKKKEMFDNWLMKQLSKEKPGILHSWNGSSRNTFSKIKGTGWRLCVERSCPHNQFQYDLLLEEGELVGIPHIENKRALHSAIEELHLADVIVVPSSYSANSYAEQDLVHKVRINPLGGNFPYLERTPKPPGLKVLMVGNSFLRKGTHYLIEAFKLLDNANAELWIRGEVPNAYRSRITDSRIKIIPPISLEHLRNLYKSADVFVQPSIDEGFGMTVFEALGYGLPLVVTENVGSKDLLTRDVAVTVPIRDPYAIATAIMEALHLPGLVFDNARKAILANNTWRACAQRMIDSVYLS